MENAICRTEIIEGCRSEFTTIISSKNLDFVIIAIFNNGFKIFENIEHIRLEFKKIKSSEFCKIINKHYIILVVIDRGNWSRAPYITMHQF